jgi:phosphoribosylformylglycinamidine cyclo-ligase
MSVNDLVVQGGEPLFFLDYIGIEKKDPQVCRDLVKGIVEGCRRAGCALLGGETASLPTMYAKGEYDLAGFCVGLAEKSKIVDGKKVVPGDVLIGVHSSGLHSNGYSLARQALLEVGGLKLDAVVPELNRTLADELLEPTIIYADAVRALLKHYPVKENVHAMANITGSGMPGNIPRTIPNGLRVRVNKGTWPIPPIFTLIQKCGQIADAEMYDTFNMGIGMTIACPEYNANKIQTILREQNCASSLIGSVEAGEDEKAEATVILV